MGNWKLGCGCVAIRIIYDIEFFMANTWYFAYSDEQESQTCDIVWILKAACCKAVWIFFSNFPLLLCLVGKLEKEGRYLWVPAPAWECLCYRSSTAAHPGHPLKSHTSHTRADVAAELAKKCRTWSWRGCMSQMLLQATLALTIH